MKLTKAQFKEIIREVINEQSVVSEMDLDMSFGAEPWKRKKSGLSMADLERKIKKCQYKKFEYEAVSSRPLADPEAPQPYDFGNSEVEREWNEMKNDCLSAKLEMTNRKHAGEKVEIEGEVDVVDPEMEENLSRIVREEALRFLKGKR